MSAFLGVPVGAAYHLVFALTQLLTPVAGGLAAATAIVLFTAAARLLISPLSLRALRGQAATARLAPQVQSLRTRYRGQPERLQRELTALYKREAASPFAGFLPLLAQWPLLSVLYLLFRSATVDGGPNQLLSGRLFGVPLGAHWLSGTALLSTHDAVFLAVFAALAALCWLSVRLARRPAAPSRAEVQASAPAPGRGSARGGQRRGAQALGPATPARTRPATPARPPRARGTTPARPARGGATTPAKPPLSGPASSPRPPRGGATTSDGPVNGDPRKSARQRGSAEEPASAEPVPGAAAAGVLTQVLPYVTVVIAAFAPLAAALYLLVTVAWTLGERRLFQHRARSAASVPLPGTG